MSKIRNMIDVKIEQFEGPLSLLLKLIEKEEMDITQISLAGVAGQFVEYLRSVPSINPDEMTDFLVIAAKLLFIKSKALLPYLQPEEEEEIEELERQLRMYKEFLEATKKIEKILGKKCFMFEKEFNRKAVVAQEKKFSPPAGLDMMAMKNSLENLIERRRPAEKLGSATIQDRINIEDRIISIRQLVMQRIRTSFTKILSEAKSKTEVIVNFLAALELMRQREVVLVQEELFGEIFITSRGGE